MHATLSGLTTPQLNPFTPPLLIPMKAAFFASPCFSVRHLYHVSHTLPCAPASGAANAICNARLGSSTSACGSCSHYHACHDCGVPGAVRVGSPTIHFLCPVTFAL